MHEWVRKVACSLTSTKYLALLSMFSYGLRGLCFIFYLISFDDFVGFCTSLCTVAVAYPTVNVLYSVNLNAMQVPNWLLHCIL